MSTQSKVTSPRRKSKSVITNPNVVEIDPKRREAYDLEKWIQEYSDFLAPLNERETWLVKESFRIIFKRPEKQNPESSEVIPFPAR